jgi:uncharacterized protein
MDSELQPGISVTGTGRVTVEPDIATLRVGVSLADRDVDRVRGEAAAKASAARDRLLAEGVAAADIRTAHLNVHTSQDGGRGQRTHHVSTTLEAVIRDVATAEAIVDRLFETVGSGLDLHGLEFGVVDPRPGRDRAIEAAVADARHTARHLADLAGVTLGPVLALRELDQHRGHVAMAAPMMARAEVSMPVETGRLELQAAVALRYAIGEAEA